MSRSERIRPMRAALVTGALIGALALAGCGAGKISQTADQQAAVSGANLTTQHIEIRNAEIEFPVGGSQRLAAYTAGASAPVTMSIANDDDLPDRLVSASSPIAGTVRITGDTQIAPHGALSASTTPGGVVGNLGSPIEITLEGLRQDIGPGLGYPLTLVFERAGSVTVELPMGNADNLVPGESGSAGSGGTGGSGGSGGH
ncbi:copper chaperone PCu(A)C [Pseudonocardia sp. N23]|uniref:copper chaperone PCu(A)C n=1 Tax=Pseudonocardia sp. N23 TaxID=1987376 RepID=UPI000BFB8F55|nr:copper chaperone PCu(A)C [Pseudonocardia sp. N23]GAY08737.1 possible conserved lipoprotein LpqE [Pseudonocardia sp. N23]